MEFTLSIDQSVWKQLFQEALFECDATSLKPKLEAALDAVEDRLVELGSDPAHRRERAQLEFAKSTIAFLEEHDLRA